MVSNSQSNRKEIIAMRVNQWLEEWEKIKFSDGAPRRRPDPYFFLFKLKARDLKALSGIYSRSTKGGLQRSLDLGIQRRHQSERSETIAQFVQYGYPWSELSKAKRDSGKFGDLRKPGWLPTAIIVNIVKSGTERPGQIVSESDRIIVQDVDDNFSKILLPDGFSGETWNPQQSYPIEVIDGQHRLWAFENLEVVGDFEFPVVAFYGLDLSWQAYLFWTINVKPVRINASLAFDLYPLLRTEDWLEKFEGPAIYRETRAQELVEALWSYPKCPWYQRINMLGEPGGAAVSQAAWIRSLLATYIKPWEGRGLKIGGLFGAPVGKDQLVLPWSRAQQASFLILVWQQIEQAIKNCNFEWAQSLREEEIQPSVFATQDPAFSGEHSLLNTDQGVRAILYITNDLCYFQADYLQLADWEQDQDSNASDMEAIKNAFISLSEQESIGEFIKVLAETIAIYDWRTADAESLKEKENEKTLKLAFRGSGGYKELRRQLLKLISNEGERIGETASKVLYTLGYR